MIFSLIIKKKENPMYKNVFMAFFCCVIDIAISFLAQRFFIILLGVEFLGLNGLFSNIISMLAIFELGIGSAITFSLYKPLVKDDKPTIKALMNFYKKAYRIITVIVGVVGLGITPFLPLLIKEVTIDINIYVVYLMFLADVVCSYLLTYRRSILYADQKNYQISYVHIGYLILMNALQLGILALTHDYYLFLGVKIVMRVVENLVIHLIVRKQYPYLNKLDKAKLDKELEQSIFQKIKALLFHKIGTFIVLGSDNIIISKFIGLAEVGLYSNYYLVIGASKRLIGQAISALTPTIGHKLAIDISEKTYRSFQKTRFVGFCMACLSSVLFLTCMQPLIKLWLGGQYLLDFLTIAMLSFNMFQQLQRYAFSTFKEAAGIYHEDRFIPLVESGLNIVASIVLLQFFGMAGVFMGTTISGLALWCYSYPRFVYKGLFKRSYWQYARETGGYILIFLICATLSYLATSIINVGGNIATIIVNAIVSMIISGVIIVLTLHKSYGFQYFFKTIKSKLLHEKE